MGSSILFGVGATIAATVLDTVLLRTGRNINGIIPDCVIEERHKDELELTQSPVEEGSPISDHAYLKPSELLMRVAWSDSKSLGSLVGTLATGGSFLTVDDVYQQLLDLQGTLQPFSIETGKRSYDNMMLRSLQVVTNRESENSLMVEALFQEVIIVSTKVQSASSLQMGTPAKQASPQNTAAPVSSGNLQLNQPNAAAGATITGMEG